MGESAGLDLRRSLSAARTAFEESEMPPRPAFSCWLRKSGPRPEGMPVPFTPRGFGKQGLRPRKRMSMPLSLDLRFSRRRTHDK